MPQLDTLETSLLSFFFAVIAYAFVFWFPEDDADEEDEIEISYLGLRAIQYFVVLRACILLYNLSYYGLSHRLINSFKSNTHNAFFVFVLPSYNVFFTSPFEQFMDDDILFLTFSTLAVFFNVLLEEDDYSDDDFFTIFDGLLEDIVDRASTAVLGC